MKPSKNQSQPKRGWPHRRCAAEFDALEVLRAKWEAMWRAKCAELDELREQAAIAAAGTRVLADEKVRLEASLSGAREELRQARRDHALAEQRAAVVTADTLGAAMQRLEHKDFLNEDRRHVRQMDGAEDHL